VNTSRPGADVTIPDANSGGTALPLVLAVTTNHGAFAGPIRRSRSC